MADTKQRIAAEKFAAEWAEREGYERGETQPFWIALLANIFGVKEPEKYIFFEKKIKNVNQKYIDCYIPTTRVLIEQKSRGIDLTKEEPQSDKKSRTPFQQALNYNNTLKLSEKARWIVVCNFDEFNIYDMSNELGDIKPEILYLKDFAKEFHRLHFLVDEKADNISKEMDVSFQAGDLVGKIYDAFLKEYKDPKNPESLKSLNKLCVRLVFCLYAEDAGIFRWQNQFHDYLKQYSAKDARRALIDLFKVLDQKETERDPYLDESLAAFPYVNGGLFSDENIEIPQFTDKIMDLLLNKASLGFNWSDISPTIFGAIFESTLNPETRHDGGMHYTSITNIHKVIDPLFLDNLKAEFEQIKNMSPAYRKTQLDIFQKKIAGLKFLDPACGSGNFLTETYLSLRKLENEVIKLTRERSELYITAENIIQVSIGQFYGIEINDFAVTVAKTALWIAESQMMKETEKIVFSDLQFLPLKTYTNIIEGNSLREDWEALVPKDELNYIMGNPPFLGARVMGKEQKEDMLHVFGKLKGVGNLDYVTAWYKKAAQYMKGTRVMTAFVSSNSITQGEQPPIFWRSLCDEGNPQIIFAYRNFKWSSESNGMATVHCVIIGFDYAPKDNRLRCLFDEEGNKKYVSEINAYLVNGKNIIIESRRAPLSTDTPKMIFGSMPNDDGNLIINTEKEYEDFVKRNPNVVKYIHPLVGAEEFINNKKRWCLWFVDASPSELTKSHDVMERIEKVRTFRLGSNREATRNLAKYPSLFGEVRQPESNYILVPSTSSEKREYIPMGFMPADAISTNANLIIPDATLYHFGVLTSQIHMAWMKTVGGRLETRYRYSASVIYNNFPWPNPNDEQKTAIEKEAQAVLDARAAYPESSLGDLYNKNTMPKILKEAHERLDKAVEKAYGRDKKFENEAEIVAYLMEEYQKLANNK